MKGIYTWAENLDGGGFAVLWMLHDGQHVALHLADNEAEAKRVCETLRAAFPDGPGGGGQVDDVHEDITPSPNGHDQADDPDSGVDLSLDFKPSRTRCPYCGNYAAPGRETCDHPACLERKKKGTGPGGVA